MRQQETARLKILSGWKEIANYLGKGVRTVQRYEREMHLPIHRPAGKLSAAVVAVQSELDNWVTGDSIRVDSMPRRRALSTRTNRLRADFLLIDSEIALTFAGIALGASEPAKRRRTTQTARKAYDTIVQFRQGTKLTDAEKTKLDANLRLLKSKLQSLGQSF